MASPNFGSFFDGYYQQQRSDVLDAEAARAAAGAAQRDALFAQQQAEFAANAPLRALERASRQQTLQGGMDLFSVTNPAAVQAARFTATADAATRDAQLPMLPELAAAGAQTLRDRALATASAAGGERARTEAVAGLFQDPAFLASLVNAQRDTATAAAGRAGVQAALFSDPAYTTALTDTALNIAATQSQDSALARVLSADKTTMLADPKVRELAAMTARLSMETQALDALMTRGDMAGVNTLLRPSGMEAKMEGAVPMVRRIGETEWRPWAGAMAMPFYKSLAANLENAAQAHEREAAAAKASAAARAPSAPATQALGIPAAPTPVAGRQAPAPVTAPAPAPVTAPAPTAAPVPVAAPAPSPAPASPIDTLGAQLDQLGQQRAAAYNRFLSYGSVQRARDPQGYLVAKQTYEQVAAAEQSLRQQYQALVMAGFKR